MDHTEIETAIEGKIWDEAVATLERMRPGSYLHKYWSVASRFAPDRLKVGVDNGKVVLEWTVIDYKGKPAQCYASWG
jgi:hypothetical protein